jgi:hypothetical protein
MKRFRATACYYTYCTAEIEAEDEDQAHEMARQMDGGGFTNTDKGDWRIIDVEEVTDGE